MPRLAARLGIAAFFLSLGYGQSADRLLAFTQTNTAQGYQEIGNVIRSVAEVQGSVDPVQKTLSVSGAPDKLAAAAWLFKELDAPVAVGQPGASQQYTMTGVNDNNLRVYRLVNVKAQTALQELVNAARSVLEINRMFPVPSQNVIALRTTQEKVAAADFLIGQLDRPSDAVRGIPPAQYRYIPVNNQPADLVWVCYLKYAQTPRQLQEIVNAVRSLTEMNRMFPYSPLFAVAARDAEWKIAAAQWLIQELDKPVLPSGQPGSGEPAMSEYRVAAVPTQPSDVNVMRVFRLSNANTPQALQSIVNAVRVSTKCQRMFPDSSQRAIAMRGTEAQAAEAERLIKQMDVASIR